MNFINTIIENINTREELNNLTDRELRDIGLTRYDINTYCKTTVKEDLIQMFTKFKNFILQSITTWQETVAMRDKILAKYKHIGS